MQVELPGTGNTGAADLMVWYTYHHQLWVVTKRMNATTGWIHFRDRVRSSEIPEEVRIEPLFLSLERSQMVVQASGKDTSWTSPWGGVFFYVQSGGDPGADPEFTWPWYPLRGAAGSGQGEGSHGFSTDSATPRPGLV